ncbi:transglutaminase-like domain-containing protein [Flammeovirga aprica]|uniref:Transglutaminase domain-containing protein n=1 Tax=Flammeovirga aprica JL-4 TaxID=694437 RepID=A0A7X9RZX4_9BACT|nr:transglutaminase-like domain-containing protein [Flammeovirga aprica]NME71780.1 transglutaminase domain-containing protein [Flammeovirga aprica JL-4]
MKRIITFFISIVAFISCTTPKYDGIDQEYHQLLDNALTKAGKNKTEIEKALNSVTEEKKNGMAFLIAYMPERDLKSLKSEYLINNINLAYQAKNEFPWAQTLPDSIFFNDVLPYALMNERRDDWRQDFYNRFAPIVKDCKTIEEAIKVLNDTIIDVVQVKYSTEREKPDQSPYESIDQGLASCSGLSVLLADAFRAVGIPSRLAGTPNWTLKKGNHNWNEVWLNGRWYFTEYYPSGLDQGWFLADAGVADVNKPENWIYASSWKPAEHAFPLVWDYDIKYVHAHNVTDRYIGLWKAEEAKRASQAGMVSLRVKMFKNKECTLISDNRVETQVTLSKDKKVIENGSTAGPTKDMNDILEFFLEKGKKYTLTYIDSKGKPVSKDITANDKTMEVTLFKTL